MLKKVYTKSTVSLARQFNAGVYLKTEQCVWLKVTSIFLPWTSLKKTMPIVKNLFSVSLIINIYIVEGLDLPLYLAKRLESLPD